MKTLKQASRLFHYCATPMLFSSNWRHNVVEKYRVTRQDSVTSVTGGSVTTPDTKIVSTSRNMGIPSCFLAIFWLGCFQRKHRGIVIALSSAASSSCKNL